MPCLPSHASSSPFGLAAILGTSLQNAALAIDIVQIPELIRVTRGEVLGLRRGAFLQVQRSQTAPRIGASSSSRSCPTRMEAPLLVQATIILPFTILAEAAL